jgi:3-hydroxy-9,10-secoandrosta-1,3,5(10)-triene-9,17-dione monooxygenase
MERTIHAGQEELSAPRVDPCLKRLNMSPVTRWELTERARKLAPVLAERARECEELRRLPDQTIADFKREGLLRAFVSPAHGGYGLELQTVIETSREIGRACGNSAWCLAICTLHHHVVSGFSEAAVKKVYENGPDAVVCGVFRPGGTAVKTEGGYRLSGAWDFASTCDHADFAVLAAFIIEEPGAEPAGMGSFLVRRQDFEIEDNWHVSGLVGTGSKRILVDEIEVHPDFVMKTILDFAVTGDRDTTARGNLATDVPGASIATLGLVGVGLGIALGALDHFKQRLSGKLREATGKNSEQQVGAQLRYAKSCADVDAAELIVMRDLSEMMADAGAGRRASLEQRGRYRRDAAWCIQTCSEAIARLSPAAGGHAIFLDDPMQRSLRDVQVLASHVVADWDAAGESYARAMLGLPTVDPLV